MESNYASFVSMNNLTIISYVEVTTIATILLTSPEGCLVQWEYINLKKKYTLKDMLSYLRIRDSVNFKLDTIASSEF